jgi:predicted transposase YbfD/YdcC
MDFLDIFGQLNDPRIERKKLHPMPEILLLTLCAVSCGAESWDDIEMFGKSTLMFLRRYLPYESGIPSDDTLRRFFRAIDTTQFQRLFIEWIRVWLNPEVAGKVVAIDGKTLRGSHDGGQSPIHLVSAFASEAGIVLGQIKTSEKSNEITAIPELLEWLDVRGAIVTIDTLWGTSAMGCHLCPVGKKPSPRKSSKKVAITYWRLKATKATCMMMCACILNSPPRHR